MEKTEIRNKSFPYQGCTAEISNNPSIIVEEGKVIYARYEIYCSTKGCPLAGAGESGTAELDSPYDPREEFQSAEALAEAIGKIEAKCPIRKRKIRIF